MIHQTVACLGWSSNLVVTSQAHRLHFPTSTPVPLHPGQVDLTLPRTSRGSAAGTVNQCHSSSRRTPRPPQSPGQSPALSPTPRGGGSDSLPSPTPPPAPAPAPPLSGASPPSGPLEPDLTRPQRSGGEAGRAGPGRAQSTGSRCHLEAV